MLSVMKSPGKSVPSDRRQDFERALDPDIVIELDVPGRALSISESLGLRDWHQKRNDS